MQGFTFPLRTVLLQLAVHESVATEAIQNAEQLFSASSGTVPSGKDYRDGAVVPFLSLIHI